MLKTKTSKIFVALLLTVTATVLSYALFSNMPLNEGFVSVLTERTIESSDDAEEIEGSLFCTDGEMILDNETLRFGRDGCKRHVGMRFTDITIPAGADIVSATINFKAAAKDNNNFEGTFYGEDNETPAAFSDTDEDLTSRTRTEANVDGDSNKFKNWKEDENYFAPVATPPPNLEPVIQELVDEYDYSEGGDIVIMWIYEDGWGERVAYSYDGDEENAPELIIEYTEEDEEIEVFIDGSEGCEEDKVQICHVPPGDPENEHTICVSENAVDAHLAHGDYLDLCEEPEPEPECGNGDVEEGEECDDGNTEDGDGCSAECLIEVREAEPECGNGELEGEEECDDGNTEDEDGCSANCTIEPEPEPEPECGNGELEGEEECDDGNTEDEDGCSSECLIEGAGPVCGNGIWEQGEECDDGNTEDGDGCSASCTVEIVVSEPGCGNGELEGEEECDDGNTEDGDGCSADCGIEGEGPVCGNEILEQGETCDDGNLEDGDGCSAECYEEVERVFLNGDNGISPHGSESVLICHRTGSDTNPYNLLSVPAHKVDGTGSNDHLGHVVDATHTYGDIIPAVDRDEDGDIDEDDCYYRDPMSEECFPVLMDYSPFSAGTYLREQYYPDGIHMFGEGAGGNHDEIIAFDSDAIGTTPDPDLEVGEGLLSILPENLTDSVSPFGIVDVPDATDEGGMQYFTFEHDRDVYSFKIVNANGEGGVAHVYDEYDVLIESVPIPNAGVGSVQTVSFSEDAEFVRKLEIIYAYDAGVTDIDLGCTPPYVENADLEIVKTDDPDPVVAGENLTYQLAITNNGPDESTGYTVTDTLPAEVSFVSATPTPGTGSCTELAGVVNCSMNPLTVGPTVYIDIVVTVDPSTPTGTILSNTASVSGNEVDYEEGNNEDTEETTVIAETDLGIEKTDSDDPVLAGGGTFDYTLTVTNYGPSDSSGYTVVDTLPSGVTFVSANPTSPTCTESVGVVTCDMGPLAEGASDVITITVDVDASASGTLSNTATVTADDTDNNGQNDTATEDTDVEKEADFSIEKTDSPDPVLAGENLTYTLTVTNNGPSDSAGYTVVDTLPPEVSFVSVIPSSKCSYSTHQVTCVMDALAAGDDDTITIVVTVDSSTPEGIITNSATVTTPYETDPNSQNNTVEEDTYVDLETDLSIDKSDSPDPVVAGQDNITYTLEVTNNGPSDSTGYTVEDLLPTDVTFVSSPDCTYNAGQHKATCVMGPLADGDTDYITIIVSVDESASGTLFNEATVTANESDPESENDTDTENTTVELETDLSIEKSDSPDPAVAGQDNITYTLDIYNNGPSDSSGYTVVDTLPSGVTFVSSNPSSPTCIHSAGVVTCDMGALDVGDTDSITITVSVDEDASGVILNEATVTADQNDPNSQNDTDTEETTINRYTDLSIVKLDSPDPVVAGESLTYTLEISNDGPSDSSGYTVVDTLPAGVEYVSATITDGTGSCLHSGGTVTCNMGALPAGEEDAIVIVVTVLPSTTGSILNTVTVEEDEEDYDPNSQNNTDEEETDVEIETDLGVSKVDSDDPVIAGENLTYTIEVTNDGPSDSGGYTVTDTLPAGTTFVSVNPSAECSYSAGPHEVTCTMGPLAVDDPPDIIEIEITVDSDTTGIIENEVTVSTQDNDPNSENDSDTEETEVGIVTDFAIDKTAEPDPVEAGSNLTYTLTITNNGPSDSPGYIVTDTLPAGVTFDSVVPSDDCSEDSGVVTCNMGPLPAGDSDIIMIVVVVDPTTTGIVNNVTVVDSDDDPDPEDNEDEEETTVLRPDLSESDKDDDDADNIVERGQTVTYTITIENIGNSTAHGVAVYDEIDSNLQNLNVVSVTDCGQYTDYSSGNVLDISNMIVEVEGVCVIVFTADVRLTALDGTQIPNSATVSYEESEEDIVLESDTLTVEGGGECGNGVVEGNEQCDDGNEHRGDGCNPDCTTGGTGGGGDSDPKQVLDTCADGVLDPGEECDDGNRQTGDGCTPTCRLEKYNCLVYDDTRNLTFNDLLTTDPAFNFFEFLKNLRLEYSPEGTFQWLISGYGSFEDVTSTVVDIGPDNDTNRLEALKTVLSLNCVNIYYPVPLSAGLPGYQAPQNYYMPVSLPGAPEYYAYDDVPRMNWSAADQSMIQNNIDPETLDFLTRLIYTGTDIQVVEGYTYNIPPEMNPADAPEYTTIYGEPRQMVPGETYHLFLPFQQVTNAESLKMILRSSDFPIPPLALEFPPEWILSYPPLMTEWFAPYYQIAYWENMILEENIFPNAYTSRTEYFDYLVKTARKLFARDHINIHSGANQYDLDLVDVLETMFPGAAWHANKSVDFDQVAKVPRKILQAIPDNLKEPIEYILEKRKIPIKGKRQKSKVYYFASFFDALGE